MSRWFFRRQGTLFFTIALVILLSGTRFFEVPGRVVSAQLSSQADINMSFSPTSISAGGVSRLSVVIFNPNTFPLTLSSAPAAWTNTLDSRLSFASPPNITTDCEGTVSTMGKVLALIGGSVPAKANGTNGSCTVSVDVTSTTPGLIPNAIADNVLKATDPTGDILITNSSPASINLLVNSVLAPSLSKSFSPNTIWAGRTSVLTIRIINNDDQTALTNVSLSDTLPPGVVVAASPNASTTCNGSINGTVTAAAGSSTISLANATVPVLSNCSVFVTVTSATAAVYTNLIPANNIQSQQGVTNAGAASAPLNVQGIGITKNFSPANFQDGGSTTLTITLQNPNSLPYSPALPYTNASFIDTFPAGLIVATPPNASNSCGGTLTANPSAGFVQLAGGTIPPGNPGTCVITVKVTSTTPASYTNRIPVGALTTAEGASNVLAASANIGVYGTGLGLTFGKSFTPNTIAVNGRSQLRITLQAPADQKLTQVTLTDALPTGMLVDSTPGAATSSCSGTTGDPAVSFNPQAGDTLLSLSSGTILADATCTLSVYVTANAPGTYTNIVSSANISNAEGRNMAGNVSANLTVSGLSVSKTFTPGTINPGGTSTLSITLSNNNTEQLDAVAFSDALPYNSLPSRVTVLPNLASPNLATTCGPVSILSVVEDEVTHRQTLVMNGGTIPAQVAGVPGICTVEVDVTSTAASTTFTNNLAVGSVSGQMHNAGIMLSNTSAASATLKTLAISIDVVQGFEPVSVFGGSASTLTITLSNPNAVPLNGIAFTDILPSDPGGLLDSHGVVRGMKVATPANPSVGTCGGTLVAVPGSSTFSYSGGSLAANSSCQLTLLVTMNMNSNLTNIIHAGDVTTSNGATNAPPDVNATLTNQPGASLGKLFGPKVVDAGSNLSTVTITIQNLSNFPLPGLGLVDTLPSGMTIATAPTADQCNGGAVTGDVGTDTITLVNGNLDDLSTCDIVVQVTAPAAGSYPNCLPIGALTNTGGISATNSAQVCDTLTVLEVPTAPTFTKAFAPTSIPTGGTSTLTFTLTNGSVGALSGVGFSDTFPGGVTLASVPNAAQCGGTVSYTANSITLTGGALALGGSCTVTSVVTASVGGSYANTSGTVGWTFNSLPYTGGSASDTLTVVAPPVIAKAFLPAAINVGQVSTLSFTLTNPAENTTTLTGVQFSDTFPAGLRVAASPNQSVSAGCSAASTPVFNPAANATSLSFSNASIAAGGSCTVSVEVTAGGGTYANTTGTVTSSNGGTGNSAGDTLTVTGGGLHLDKTTPKSSFHTAGEQITYDYLLTNTGSIPLYGSGTSGEFVITDDKAGTVSCPLANTTLAASATLSCTATYTVQAADVNARSLTNLATATALDLPSGGATVTSNTESVTLHYAALTIKKRTSTLGYKNLNDAISYAYTLTNTGTVTLYGTGAGGEFMVLDDHIGTLPGGTAFACSNSVYSLAPGAVLPCSSTQTYRVTADDLTNTAVTNTVSTTAQDQAVGGTSFNSNTDQVTVYLVLPPVISKSFAAPKLIAVGGVSRLTLTVTNPSTNVIPLTGVGFTDTLPVGLEVAATPDLYQCGGSVTATATVITFSGGTILQQTSCDILVDITSGTPGTYANTTSSVNSSNGGSGLVSNTDNLTVVAPPVITKAFADTNLLPNATTTITFTLTNPNTLTNTTLNAVAFDDSFPAGMQSVDPTVTSQAGCGADGSLAFSPAGPPYTSFSYSGGVITPGTPCVITVGVKVTTPGTKTNTTGRITSTEGGTGATSNTATLVVDNPHLTLTKVIKAGNPYSVLGGTLTYEYQLLNDGNLTLIGTGTGARFIVNDDHVSGAIVCPATPAGLAPGDPALLCTASYTITQADLDNGSVTNQAQTAYRLFGMPPENSNLATATATATQIDSLGLTKTATAGSPFNAVGIAIDYQYVLKNTGNVTLIGTDPIDGGFVVTDDKLGAVTCPATPTSLGSGDSVTCTASYQFTTQADLDAGSITNTATGYAKWVAKDETAQSSLTVNAVQNKVLTLTKAITSGGTYNQVDAQVFYRYTLRNDGNVTLSGTGTGGVFTITDDKIDGGAAFDCGSATTLPPDGSTTTSCIHAAAVTQADLDAGTLTNHAYGHAKINASPVTSNEATQTATKTASWNASVTKNLVTTEFDTTANNHTQAAIGELLTYQLVLTFPPGSTVQSQLVDTLDAGLAFVSLESVTASNPDTDGAANTTDSGLNATGMSFAAEGACNSCTPGTGANNPLLENNGRTLTFNFGRVDNTAAGAETITILYKVVVLDVAGSQAGTLLNNAALFSWSGGSAAAAAAQVTVVEPAVVISKSGSKVSGVDAGDALDYTLTLTSSGPTAYEVTLSDQLPEYYVNPTLDSVTGAPADQFEIVNCPVACLLRTTAAADLDLTTGTPVVIVVKGTLAANIPPNTSLSNQAVVRWTSLNGTVAARSSFNAASVERTGADGVGGALDDYAAASAWFYTTSDPLELTKTLVSTSEAHTSAANVAIGEIARFRLQVKVPEGTSRNLQLQERLPVGLTFLNDSSAKLAFVCTNTIPACAPTSSTLPGASWSVANATVAAVTPTYVLQDADISASASANSDGYVSGSDVFFKLGNLTNAASDVEPEYVVIEFNALVDNSTAGNNTHAKTLSNDFIATENSVQSGNSPAATVLTVLEPSFSLTKTVPATTGYDAGDTITYTLTLTAAGTGATRATAFEISLSDTLDANLDPVSEVIQSTTQGATCAGGQGFASNISRTGQAVTLTAACLDPGQSLTAVITAKVTAAAVVGTTIPNTANLVWSSLPGDYGTNSNPTGSPVNAAPGADAGERNGSAAGLNSYHASANASITLTSPTLTKTNAARSTYTIGETVQYDLRVNLPEGLTQNLVVTDLIPSGSKPTGGLLYGMKYVSAQVLVSDASLSGTWNGSSSVSPDITLVSGVCAGSCITGDDVSFTFGDLTLPNDNDSSNNAFIIRVTLLIEDVPGNQDRLPSNAEYPTTFVNSASASYNSSTLNSSAAAISLVEPRLTTTKSVSPTSNVKAGDTLTYTVRFTNTGSSTAYDVTALDTLAQGVSFASVTSCNYFNGTSAAPIPYSVVPAGGQLSFASDVPGGWDIPTTASNAYIECIYTATAQSAMVLNGSHTNTIDADWSSLDGAHVNERLYVDGALTNMDGTQDQANASFTTGTVTLSKSDGGLSQATIGDSVTYTITVGGASGLGTLQNLAVTDTLPAGLIYDSGELYSGFSTTPNITTTGTNDGVAGLTIKFDFGTTIKSQDNATITFSAHVADVVSNAKGTTRTNSVSATYQNVANGTVTLGPATDALTIAESVITTTKSVSPTTNVKAGDTLTYTVRFTNTGNANAYDVTALDVMPQGVTFTSVTSCVYSSGGAPTGIGYTTAVNTVAGIDQVTFDGNPANTGGWDLPVTVPTSYIECIYTGTAQSSLILNGSHTNTIDADWTSQNDAGTHGERNYNDVPVRANVDAAQDAATAAFTTGTVTLSKNDGGVTLAAIGDSITYTITVGGTNVLGTLKNLVVTDTLPIGLVYDGGEVYNGFSKAPDSILPPSPNIGGTVGSIVYNFGDVVKTADTATIVFKAHIADNMTNARGTARSNSVSASYTNLSGSTVNLGPTGDSLTIAEPVIATTKNVSPITNVKAGDTLTYTVRFTNTGNATAFDVTALDTLPAGISFNSISACSYFNGTSSSAIPAAAAVDSSLGYDRVTFNGNPAGSWDIPATAANAYIECSYTATATPSLRLDGSHVNLIDADWTSQNDAGAYGERNYDDSVSRTGVDESQDAAAASFTSGAPSLSKSDGGITQTVIGQVMHYTLTITSPLGTLRSTQVVDSLPAGLIYVVDSQAVGAGISAPTSFSASGPTDGSGAVTLTWTFGDAVISSSPVTLEFDAIVANVAANQNAVVRTNTANLHYTNLGGGDQTLTASDSATIIEPVLNLAKSAAAAVTNPDAGDEITYTLTITHAAASSATAYDLTLSDLLPAYADWQAGSVQISGAGAATVTDTSNDGSNTVQLEISDLAQGSTLTITYKTLLTSALTPKQAIVNTAHLAWTSRAGTHNPGLADGERDGSGGINDYTTSASASLTAADLAPVKSIVVTSEAHTAESGNGSNNTNQARLLAVGEVLRYRLSVTLPEGTLNSLTLADTLPAGLSYLGLPKISFISNSAVTLPADLAAAGDSAVPPVQALPAARLNVSGQNLTFALGNVVNNDSDADAEQVVVEFNVLVSNVAGNVNTTVHDNRFSASISGGTAVQSNHIYTQVVEPALLLDKTAAPATNWQYHDTLTYTLSLSSAAASSAEAFNLRISDTIPAGLTYVPASLTVPANWVKDDSAAPNLVWTCDGICSLPLAGSAAFSYQVTVDAPPAASALLGNATATNTATLTYTSLPGANGSTSNATGSDTPGVSGAADGERTGSGGVNSYTTPAAFTGGITPYYAIGNRIWQDNNNNSLMDAGETGIDGVTVQLFAAADSSFAAPLGSAITANGGFYLFDFLLPGDYVVVLPASNFSDPGKLVNHWSSGTFINAVGASSEATAPDPDVNPIDSDDNGTLQSGSVVSAAVTLGGAAEPTGEAAAQQEAGVGQGAQPDNRANLTLDFGFFQMTSLGDQVWLDTNANGIQEGGELGLNGVTVNLYHPGYGPDGIAGNGDDAQMVNTTTTAQLGGVDGSYEFTDLVPGSYVVEFMPPVGYAVSRSGQGADPALDSDPDPASHRTTSIILVSNQTDLTRDAGLYQVASLGNQVWTDTNANGLQDAGESGLNGVTVNLYRPGFGLDGIPGNGDDAQIVATATTAQLVGVDGSYNFANLVPGSYQVEFIAPTGYSHSPQGRGADSTIDSDADVITGRTTSILLISQQTDLTWDAGLYQKASLGDLVWNDVNFNGIQDDGESGYNNVSITLYRPGYGPDGLPGTGDDAESVGSASSANVLGVDGKYSFTNLDPGTYDLVFTLPAGYVFSPRGAGADASKDSNANPATGRTASVTLNSGDVDNTLDGGIYFEVKALGIEKSALPTNYAAVSTVIQYSYVVTNTGNVTLPGPFTVNDDRATDELCPVTASLAAGASITCTASYTITQADLDTGSVTNVASASNGSITSATDTVTVTATQSPALGITKSATPGTYSAVGDVISYSYTVTNSGNITLSGPFTVSDDRANDESCPVTPSLAPGAFITCSASYTITQADLDAGQVINLAAASNALVTSSTATATVTAQQHPALALAKSASPLTYAAVGDVISYSYLLTNTGNVTLLAPFSISDDKSTDEACPVGSIAPGDTKTCTATYHITQADLDAGFVTNLASATNGTATSGTDTATVTAQQHAALGLVKSANPMTYGVAGAQISYSFVVTNTGNVTLSGPFTVSDDKTTDETCPLTASLAPGISITCQATYTILPADLDAGSLTNVASVSNGSVTSATDTVTVNAVQGPALSIAKSALPTSYASVGTLINYSFVVTNSGNITLTGPFTVSDDKATDELCPVTASLAAGASITCTASYTITQEDLDSGSVTNVASASNGSITSATDTVTVTATQTPTLGITKNATPGTYSTLGDVISYSFTVTNTGNITLHGPFIVSDDKSADESCPVTADLAVGASITCSASYSIIQADLDAGQVTNIASVSNGTATSGTATATVNAVLAPALSIAKSATPGTYNAVGNTISYSFKVTNTGNITLHGPFIVSDDKASDESCPLTANLAPGAFITCSASYSITQTDLDAGHVTNIASVSNGVATSSTDTATVNAVPAPALGIDKTATPGTYNAVGDVISYSYKLTNTGNVTLHGPFTVSDDKSSDEVCPITADLAPGAFITCTASYSITQDDLDAGFVTNIASATNGVATSGTDSATVNAVQNPQLVVVKSSTTMAVTAAAELVPYSYKISNTGNVTVTGIAAADNHVDGALSCPGNSLAPGAFMSCSATYTMTQPEIEAGGNLSNTVTVTSTNAPTVTDTLNLPITQIRTLSIIKDASPKTYSAVGSSINYSFAVSNTGNVPLNGPFTVSDDKTTNELCPVTASLAPSASITCTASYNITQADLDAGQVTNTASASNGVVTSGTASAIVTAQQNPALGIVKDANPKTYSTVGNLISYSFTVTNTGNITLQGPFTISDDKAVDEACPVTPDLIPGASVTCTASYTITQADLDAGSVTNVASVSNGSVTSATDTVTVNAVQNPLLTVEKSSTTTAVTAAGQLVPYSYKISNTGNVTVTGIAATDNHVDGSLTCPGTSLSPAASMTCTGAYSMTQAEIETGGNLTNTVTVTSTNALTVTATLNLPITQIFSLGIVKTPLPTSYNAVGNVIQYSFVVTNTGNMPLSGPFSVSDNKAADELCPVTAGLIPGASVTCTASYTITQADLDAGSVTNTASANNGTVTSATTQATVTAVAQPALSIVKDATPKTYTAVGNVISYNYLVTNTGNITLHGPFTVSDDKSSDETCPATANLVVGASITCSATYTITQADLDAGSVTNTASVSNALATSPTANATVTAVQSPAMTLAKNASPTTYAALNTLIHYSFVLTNTGNVTLLPPFTVSDNLTTNEACPAASIAPGATLTCSASYLITQTDLDVGSVTNTASAQNAQASTNTAQATVTALQDPRMTLTKSATPTTYSKVGDVIQYSYLLVNPGNINLVGPFIIVDDRIPNAACPVFPSVLAPGAGITCSASYTITQADLDAGSVTNQASAHNALLTTNTDQFTVTALQNATWTVVKSTTTLTVTAAQQVVNYSYLVTNTGNLTIQGISMADNRVDATPSCPATSLAPGATLTCTAAYTVTQADIQAGGNLTNIVTVNASNAATITDSRSIPVIQSPAMTLAKSAVPLTYSAVGNVIHYSYLLTNTGNLILTGPFTVDDDKSTDEACPSIPGGLAPGGTLSCTASYTIGQADLDAGAVTNIASASNAQVTTPTASATVTALQNPLLTVVKSSTTSAVTAAGQVVPYSYRLSNSGNITLTAISVTDNHVDAAPVCPGASLSPGASFICTAAYTVTQADIEAGGGLTNLVAVTSAHTSRITDTLTLPILQNPALSLIKRANPQTYSAVGNLIHYSFLVTNSGNLTLSGPFTVNDDKTVDEACPVTPSLAPGAQITCTASYTVTQSDLDSGAVTNTASVSNGTITSPSDSATVTAVQNLALSLVKNATPTTYATVGTVINYSFVLTNSGTVTLHGPFTVSDDKSSDEACPVTAALAPAASITCTASYTIGQADLNNGSVTNLASATNGITTSATASATVTALQNPLLTVVKSSTTSAVTAGGQVVPYSYLVTNTGNITVSGITVADNHVDAMPVCPGTTLAPGAKLTCTAAYTVTQAEIQAGGGLKNTVTVTSTNAPPVTGTLTIPITQTPALTIAKSANPNTYSTLGTLIHYTFVLTNSGNLTLSGPFTVNDNKTSDEVCPAGSLPPGASLTCTASYTITQTDLDAGFVTNTASATNGTVTSLTASATVTAVQNPALTLVKSITSGNPYARVGDQIVYSYQLSNTGNVTLTGAGPSGRFTVSDDKVTVTCPTAPTRLAPGTSLTCSASYSVTPPDLDGLVTNLATAHARFGAAAVASNQATQTASGTHLTASKLYTDVTSNSGLVLPGDVLEYTILITNTGRTAATQVVLRDTPDANTRLVVGSVSTSAGSISQGNNAGDSSVQVNLGTLAAQTGSATVVFRVQIAAVLPAGVISVSNQGRFSGSNFPPLLTDNQSPPRTPGSPTVTPITGTPQISSIKSYSLAVDPDNSVMPSPGDTLLYTIVINNTGTAPETDLAFADTLDPNTTLVAGSVTTTLGSVTLGNTAGDVAVSIQLGTLAQGGQVTITFRAEIHPILPPGTDRLNNQGSITGHSTETVTDDPKTADPKDPTFTPIVGPTAVSLLYFQAVPLGKQQVELRWATAAEINNYGFLIKRAPVNDYNQAVEVGFVPSKVPGGSGGGASYLAKDSVPQTGVWFYWLVDVDGNGKQTPHAQSLKLAVVSGTRIYVPRVAR